MMLSTNAKPSSVFFHETPSYSRSALRILCATDLSSRSDHAIERAIRISEAVGAQCMLLHVVNDDVPMRLADRRAERAHGALLWHVRQYSQLSQKPAVSVRVGKRDATIARAARDWGADLIVLGRHRRRPLETFRRSTAESVLLRADRPVLVVNGCARQDYSGVTFVARKNIGAYVKLADRFELFDSAHVTVIPHASPIDRAVIACSRIAESRTPTSPSTLLRRLQQRTGTWIQDAGLHLMGFEVAPLPLPARSVLSRIGKEANPHLLVAEVGRTSMLTRSPARDASVIAMRTGLCDVLLASKQAARSFAPLAVFPAAANAA